MMRETVECISHLLVWEAPWHPRCAVYPPQELIAAHERMEAGAGAKVLVRLQRCSEPGRLESRQSRSAAPARAKSTTAVAFLRVAPVLTRWSGP